MTNPHEVWRVQAREGVVQAFVVPHRAGWTAVLHINGRVRDVSDFSLRQDADAQAAAWRGLLEAVMIAVEDGTTA